MASSTPLSKANTTFALDLFNTLTEDNKDGNVFCSPLSISSALAMVLLGAKGNTARQILGVLYFLDVHDVHINFGELIKELNKPREADYRLSLANRLYGEKSYPFSEEYLCNTRGDYGAGLETVDFKKSAEAARVSINTWVEKSTGYKIKEILGSKDVDCDTILVLVNAIYFKSAWDKPFHKYATYDAQFKITKSHNVTVKMMSQVSEFPYASIPESKCQVLEMPYIGKDLSMLIFLPEDIEDSTTGLEKLESQLTYENFVDWTSADKMKMQTVQVDLPRFKMEEKYDMKMVLMSMGMVDAFNPYRSDFSGMSGAKGLVVSKVIHKAFLEVNEEGTEAAAATAADGMVGSSGMPPTTFMADHPFLFFIRHNHSGCILFVGRFCSPV